MDAEPERGAHGTGAIPVAHPGPVEAGERLELLVVAAEHVRRDRQPLEVVRSQRHRVEALEEVVRLRPRSTPVRLACRLENVDADLHGLGPTIRRPRPRAMAPSAR